MNFILRQVLPATSQEKPIEIYLTEDEVPVGRKSKTILAKFPQLSRDHAIFYKSEDGVLLVKDNKSLNGLYVNDVKITSLKSLKIGDTVGFGVTSNQNEIGFVCVVCSDNPAYKVKHEIIELSDSDDDVPKTNSKPVSGSTTCHIPVVVERNNYSNSNALLSKDFTSKTISDKSDVAVVNSPNKSVPSVKNVAFINAENSKKICSESSFNNIDAVLPQIKKISSLSTLSLSNDTIKDCLDKTVSILNTGDLQKKNNSLNNSAQSNFPEFPSSSSNDIVIDPHASNSSKTLATTKFESPLSHNKHDFVSSMQNFIKQHENIITSYKDSVSKEMPSEISALRSTTNAASNIYDDNSFVSPNNVTRFKSVSARHFSLRKCSIPLIRCDSEFFKWPPGIKNPFIKFNTTSVAQKCNTEITQLSNENLNMNFHKNVANTRNAECDKTEYRDKLIVQSNSQKRKYSFNSNVESLSDHPVSPKKNCLINENYIAKSNFSYNSVKNQEKNSKESECDSEEEINYSQVEDVIYLSDDDDEYLDFNSSENYVHIKTEPVDIDNLEDDKCVENLDVNDGFQDLMSDNEVDNLVNVNQGEDGSIETIESIKAFVGNTAQEVSSPFCKTNDASIIPQKNKSEIQKFHSDVENSDVEDNLQFRSSHASKLNVQKASEPNVTLTKNNAIKSNLNKNGKITEKSGSKIQLIDAQPLEYRPRKMRGRDERVVEKTKKVVEKTKSETSPKKKKLDNSKKELLSKLADNSKLKNFKIPRKHNNESNSHSSRNTGVDQPSNSDVSHRNKPVFTKKSPTVKTKSYKSTSRMGFLVHDVEINPQRNNKPVAVVEGHRKTNVTTGKNHMKQNNISAAVPSKSTAQLISHVPEILNKNAGVPKISDISNPRDPRQHRQRIPSSSAEVWRDSSMLKASLPDEGNAHSRSVPPNSAYYHINMVSSGSKAIERPISYPMQNNVKNKNLQKSISCHNQNNNSNKAFETPIQTTRQNHTESFVLRSKLIKDLLYLNTKWLQEQARMKKPPDPVKEGASELPLKYDSFDSYVSSFYPMLMLEIWEQMYIESKEVFKDKNKCNRFLFSILEYTSKSDLIELKCESVVNEKVDFAPCEGSLTILELKENSRRINPVFGYIFKHRSESLVMNSLKLSHWRSLPEASTTNAKHWTFYVHIKKKEMHFALDSLMKGNGLCYIRNKLRLLDALTYLKNSPLITDILQPRWKTFFVKYSAMAPTREFNSGQMEVIECVTSEIIKSKGDPKIILLQGPPGTGKTRTIIGLIQKFLTIKNFNSNYKILVTAPSNAAVDEIGCRLIDLNEKFKDKGTINFVRVGILEQTHAKMKPYTLDRKANFSRSDPRQKEKELQSLKYEITKLKKEVFNREGNERLKGLEDRYKQLTDENYGNQRDNFADIFQKQKLLKESHIILSTLSGCGLSLLLKTFKPNSSMQFSYCIVDESTQCTELEILQPLMLGIRKLVLVGDHKQLPATVLSKTACKYGFERSAFERFHTYFEMYCKKTPMFTLTEQFRMHSSICEFPSKFIYNHKLITNPNVDVEYANFPLLPYMMLNIYVSQEKDDLSSKVNCTEAQVIINICTVLLDCIVDSVSSIGIITPYQAQKSLYIKALGVNPRYKDIEVNTVDSFQGREKDIIIISTVRANSQSGGIGFVACKRRLNVAITRAKKCLIVCVHADSLINYDGWRELIDDAKDRNICFAVTSPKDIPYVFKTYMQKNRSSVSNYV